MGVPFLLVHGYSIHWNGIFSEEVFILMRGAPKFGTFLSPPPIYIYVLWSIPMLLFVGMGGLLVGGKTGENAIVCFLDACKETVQGVCFFGLSS